MLPKTYTIFAEWDEEASVWVAQSDDVPGLATYGESIDHLIEDDSRFQLKASRRGLAPIDLVANSVINQAAAH